MNRDTSVVGTVAEKMKEKASNPPASPGISPNGMYGGTSKNAAEC